MSIAAHFETERSFNYRRGGKVSPLVRAAGVSLTLLAILPFAVAAIGILRHGFEPYMVLAALLLG